jgi:hypothetical protein
LPDHFTESTGVNAVRRSPGKPKISMALRDSLIGFAAVFVYPAGESVFPMGLARRVVPSCVRSCRSRTPSYRRLP